MVVNYYLSNILTALNEIMSFEGLLWKLWKKREIRAYSQEDTCLRFSQAERKAKAILVNKNINIQCLNSLQEKPVSKILLAFYSLLLLFLKPNNRVLICYQHRNVICSRKAYQRPEHWWSRHHSAAGK